MRLVTKVVLLILSLLLLLNAYNIRNSSSVLSKVEIYNSKKELSVNDLNDTMFKPLTNKINIGLSTKSIWLKVDLFNKTRDYINKIALLNSSLIDKIEVYELKSKDPIFIEQIDEKGGLRDTKYPYFDVKLKPHKAKRYYIHVVSSQIPSSFDISIEDKGSFFSQNRADIISDSLAFGFLLTVAIGSILLYLYKKEKSYIYFGIFVLISLYYLFSYTGLAHIVASKNFYLLDKTLSTIKLNLIIVLSSLYSLLFLKLNKSSFMYKVYMFIIAVSIIQIIASSFTDISYYFVLFVSALYAITNVIAAVSVYTKGLKEARFYIIGMIILAVGIFLNIFNALNMNILNNININYMVIFTLAVIFLLLAYADRYYSSTQEEFNLLTGMLDKKFILDRKVQEKQDELANLISSEETIKSNISNLIKNNLQTTLTMLKLQEPKVKDQEMLEQLKSLESKILAIVKSYTLFLSADNSKNIDMQKYLTHLLSDIKKIYANKKKLNITADIDATLKLDDALYVSIHFLDFIINRYEDDISENENIHIYLKSHAGKYSYSIKDISHVSKKAPKKRAFNFKELFRK